ncbi:MAG: hypothetical protein VXX53_08040, partial [Pseudomonadota bacterium]|nr:hypothetical protein [Pseudomonadota bacterium]
MNRQRVMVVGRLARATLFAAIAVLWLIPALAAQTLIEQVEVEAKKEKDPNKPDKELFTRIFPSRNDASVVWKRLET